MGPKSNPRTAGPYFHVDQINVRLWVNSKDSPDFGSLDWGSMDFGSVDLECMGSDSMNHGICHLGPKSIFSENFSERKKFPSQFVLWLRRKCRVGMGVNLGLILGKNGRIQIN